MARTSPGQAAGPTNGTAWVGVLLCLLLGACSGAKVAVPDSAFPVPVIDPLPLNVAVVLDEGLRNYTHQESLEKAGDWEIDLGSAQPQMFSQLFKGLFTQSAVLDGLPEAPSPYDGLFVPSIAEVQFSTPTQTRTDYFEVWIRYQFKLYDNQGTLLGEWPLAAYGKANQRNYGMSPNSPALEAAALAACRDAMAFFTLQLRSVPVINTWIDSQIGSASP